MEEIWKDIEGFPGYQVSNLGRVRSWLNTRKIRQRMPHILKPGIAGKGYLVVNLTNNNIHVTKGIHRLVAEAFIPNPENKPEVNHDNGDKSDNSVSNLVWATRSENAKHAIDNGLHSMTPAHETNKRRIRIKETGEEFDSIKECAEHIHGNPSNIVACLSDKYIDKTHKGFTFEYANKSKRKPFLYSFQMDAVKQMFNGCILCGGVGSGKSRTGLYYYFSKQGGSFDPEYKPMRVKPKPKDLIIITTAKKRNTCEWIGELAPFLLSANDEQTKRYGNKIIIDSWNNIKKYIEVKDSFFIFDEHHAQGSGIWSKSFLKIAKSNEWIILSATPGDQYMDYLPVFLAHGFYKNKTEFTREHVVYSRFTKYPKIEKYINTGRLNYLISKLLVDMDFIRHTVMHREDVYVKYDTTKYKQICRTRWNPWTDEPIQQASGLCYALRRIVNEDMSRQVALLELYEQHPKMIVFYSFDYELDILKNLAYGEDVVVAQYNGHQHDPLPEGDKWVYLVNYNACEGWNAITTDTIVFYSQTYSYKTLVQAEGRINRLNSPFTDLYYYNLKTRSGIDLAISKALKEKKNFNETKWAKW